MANTVVHAAATFRLLWSLINLFAVSRNIRNFACMACTTEFINFVCEILAPLGEVRSRRMMGDYIIYVNEKCVITACDNNAYIKKLDCIASLMADAETGCAYEGAKEAYILDFSDRRKVCEVISILWEALPFPKKRKRSTRQTPRN